MTRVVYGPEIFRQRYGGISRYIAELHSRMSAEGVDSRIFAGLHANEILPRQGVMGRRLPARVTRGFGPLGAVNDAALRQWLRRQPPDTILHKSYFTGRAQDSWRGPVAVTVYDLIHVLFPEHFPEGDRTVELQRAACARADVILAISQTTGRDLQQHFGVAASKIVVTPLGVSPPSEAEAVGAEPPPGRGQAAQAVGVNRPYVLYVGSRGGYKNWQTLARAYASSPVRHEVDLVCAGGGAFTADESALLRELGVASHVVQRAVDDRELGHLYRCAAVYAYPSLYEGFGLPPLEAMARGCPVVAAGSGSIPEVLGNAALLVDPKQVDDIAAALERVVSDEDLRGRLVQLGHARAAAYTWDRTAHDTAAAYRSVLSG